MTINANTIATEGNQGADANVFVSLVENKIKDEGPVQADIFANLDALRLSADAAAVMGTSEILSHVPVRKPNRHEFFRSRAETEFWFDTGIFEDKEERETFFCHSSDEGGASRRDQAGTAGTHHHQARCPHTLAVEIAE